MGISNSDPKQRRRHLSIIHSALSCENPPGEGHIKATESIR